MVASRYRGLHGQVIEDLGARIATGELAAGTRLVPEAVAEQLGVSRTVVREGLRVLEAKRMVRARPRVGTVVQPPHEWDSLDRDLILWRVRGPDRSGQLRDLLQLRGAIEPVAVRLAASTGSPELVEHMRNAMQDMREAVARRDLMAFTRADTEFHTSLLHGSGNSAFGQLADTLYALFIARVDNDLLPEVIAEDVLEAHARLLAHLEEGDGDGAATESAWLIVESSHALEGEVANIATQVLAPAGISAAHES